MLPTVKPVSRKEAELIVSNSICDKATHDLRVAFHNYWYQLPHTWRATTWMGKAALKCPFDLWMYQELIFGVKPWLIIETGTGHGGSTLFYAHLCDLAQNGVVLTVDVEKSPELPQHQRIHQIVGSSVDKGVVADIMKVVKLAKGPVLAILDSNHSKDHVYKELMIYSKMVTVGSYLIVEDSNVNGHPLDDYKACDGPYEAVDKFLKTHKNFMPDVLCERFMLTFNTKGYLQRRK